MKVTININDKLVRFAKRIFSKRIVIPGIIVLFFISGLVIFSESITKSHTFYTGDIISAEEMNTNFDVLYAKVNALDAKIGTVTPEFGVVPVGSIVAWHKDFPNTPALPDGWITCNGQVINDPYSVYNGQSVPDLNGEGRFLRGSNVSGTMQAATAITQKVEQANCLHIIQVDGIAGTDNFYVTSGSTVFVTGQPYYKVRPVNMSVVWIMRIR